jgi:hypothetical protein
VKHNGQKTSKDKRYSYGTIVTGDIGLAAVTREPAWSTSDEAALKKRLLSVKQIKDIKHGGEYRLYRFGCFAAWA